ncbi:MAG: hypothetical protein ACKOYM_08660 [Actinomycetes bacterium]
MHPIERLRFVARSRGAPADLLVGESAAALAAFRGDEAGLVAACRRVVDRQLTCAPLWWLCARMLTAPDAWAEARLATQEIDADPTPRHLARALPDNATVVVVGWPAQSLGALRRRGDVTVRYVDVDGDGVSAERELAAEDVLVDVVDVRSVASAVSGAQLVLLDALAVGPESALVPAGSAAAAAVAVQLDVPVWVVGGAGRLLPERMFDALVNRWSQSADPFDAAEELVPLRWCTQLAGVGGVGDVAEGLQHTDCPVAPELFRLAG